MAWIEVHQALVNHRKTMRLAAVLRCGRPQAVGHLVSLWLWALDNVDEDGLMADVTADEVSMAAGWDGDADVFFDAMVRAGFLESADGEVVLHDWGDYGGKLSTRRAANRARMREVRGQARATNVQRTDDAQPSNTAHVQRTNDARGEDVRETDAERVGLQYSTVENTTEHDSTEQIPPHDVPTSVVLKELYGDLTTTKSDLARECCSLESEFGDDELLDALAAARASGIGRPWPRELREHMPKHAAQRCCPPEIGYIIHGRGWLPELRGKLLPGNVERARSWLAAHPEHPDPALLSPADAMGAGP